MSCCLKNKAMCILNLLKNIIVLKIILIPADMEHRKMWKGLMKSIESNKEKKEREVQEWLDQVHFGSCCSDSAEDDLTKKPDGKADEKDKNVH
jgi:hypothetical protein